MTNTTRITTLSNLLYDTHNLLVLRLAVLAGIFVALVVLR